MIDYIKKSLSWALGISTCIFTFVPESFFEKKAWISESSLSCIKWLNNIDAQIIDIIISRILCLLFCWVVASFFDFLFRKLRRRITIKGLNYSVRIEYGDILKVKKCKRIISFDECFTTKIGQNPEDIKPSSICGQYLITHPDIDVQRLIEDAHVVPDQKKSKYNKKNCYIPGTLVPNGNDLLMAFARLDERGKGHFFTRDEYIECLDHLWKELEYYYASSDVCIPILGSGITSFDGSSGASYSQQELLDIILTSYKLTSHKIKSPKKLRIICKKTDGFSLDAIER